ncbi:MAG: metalloregulator ArsR/SmtB family transcription factor [Clostridiales bacterium]|jgi:ArsR family transcriptional regulator|nr:metalloregulator ArsR/SmtB family transcription factor [Clostridiales bacterium]
MAARSIPERATSVATDADATDATVAAAPAASGDDDALCSCTIIHEDIVSRVREGLSGDALLRRTAEMFKAVSDPTRLKIINALILSEMCVCDIAALTDMTQPAVSHHLKVLRQLQLVRYRRDGKIVYYELDDEHVRNVFYQGLLHASEQ